MIMEQKLEIHNKVKTEDEYSIKSEELKKYFLQSPFSSKSFHFYPTKNDWKIIRKHVPTVLLYITNRCNSFCKICFTNSTPFDYSKNLSKKDIIKILKKIGRKKRVVLIGGEPTVRDDLFEIIEIIRKSGNHPELYTNGLRLSDISYAKKLKQTGVKRIYFSFDGFRSDVYEKMSGNYREMGLKLLALRNLQILGIDVIISARIVKGLNEDQVKNLTDFCVNSAKRRGCVKGVYFYGATRYGRFLLENSEISTSELVGVIEKATNHEVDLEYLIEMKKLALNLFKIFSRFGLSFPFASGGLIGLYKAGSIKKLLSIDFVRKINRYLEKGKILTAIYKSLKNKEIRKILIGFMAGKDLLKAITMNGIFILGIGNVNTPLNHRGYFSDSLGFEKGKRTNIPFVNASNYADIGSLPES